MYVPSTTQNEALLPFSVFRQKSTNLLYLDRINTDKSSRVSYLSYHYAYLDYSMYPHFILQDIFKLIFLLKNKFHPLLQFLPILLVNVY